MNTWHIHIEGQVQGVGFRPFVFALAQEYGLKGWVNNTFDGVHVVFNADQQVASTFMEHLLTKAPRLSKITAANKTIIPTKFFENFQIIHSVKSGDPSLLLTPDFALCEACRVELKQINDRRYAYAFITCTNCGPRYSIVHSLPYDRVNTKMDCFQMCSACHHEYNDPFDRRYYSQTNSCSDCGVELILFDAQKNVIAKPYEGIIQKVVAYWKTGKIVAIKGIGGYLLTCDASNENAISELRKRKHRPSKPFALMYPSSSSLTDFHLYEESLDELNSHIAPIVLLVMKQDADITNEIAKDLNRIGVMMPYTPLYEILLDEFGRSIVATSGNTSNAPIIYEDEVALNELSKIADAILMNNRDIVIPQDDSVVQYSIFERQKIILRRSRGYAPTYINPSLQLPSQTILAMGAMLKSTFCFLHQGNTYISQYLGDLSHFDTQQNYQNTIQHFLALFQTRPEIILTDQHPAYPSSQYGDQLSSESDLTVRRIQHHVAHFGAILGEHDLIHSQESVLGVIWDGTGLGDDGQIWGGEFFKYENYDFSRCYSFDYFDSILGDKMPKEPRISALSACWGVVGSENLLSKKFNQTEWQVYSKLLGKYRSLKTSSVGRIFDAVASLIGIMDKQSFEGEAAMQLEAMAMKYFQLHGLDFTSSYFNEDAHYYHQIPTKTLMAKIIMDIQKGESKEFIAAKFHFSLMKIIKIIANNLKIKQITFSGGVFQNSLLVDLILYHLKVDFQLYFHKELSPNDENISFGQLVCFQIEKQKKSLLNHKSNKHVSSDSR